MHDHFPRVGERIYGFADLLCEKIKLFLTVPDVSEFVRCLRERANLNNSPAGCHSERQRLAQIDIRQRSAPRGHQVWKSVYYGNPTTEQTKQTDEIIFFMAEETRFSRFLFRVPSHVYHLWYETIISVPSLLLRTAILKIRLFPLTPRHNQCGIMVAYRWPSLSERWRYKATSNTLKTRAYPSLPPSLPRQFPE